MKTLFMEEKNTASLIQNQWPVQEFQISSVFYHTPLKYLMWDLKALQDSPFIKKEMIGTTIFTNNLIALSETEEDDSEIGYFNDDYDIVARVPFKETFKVKVKIRSITRLQPKVFIDTDELDQQF
ncbi:hypothetical protein [Anaerophaga thermohalophila]|uniref:hypothetical protein n=1 Tax=Anaerophaga thermohalophila TaxID=177400 RepID=UPI000237D40F|nr:hypothetical protein [Anaerophaga thermohalophila]